MDLSSKGRVEHVSTAVTFLFKSKEFYGARVLFSIHKKKTKRNYFFVLKALCFCAFLPFVLFRSAVSRRVRLIGRYSGALTNIGVCVSIGFFGPFSTTASGGVCVRCYGGWCGESILDSSS